MAAPFVTGTPTTASGVGAASIAWPAGHQAGDIGFLFVETDSNDASITISGWTAVSGSPLIVSDPILGTGQDSEFTVLYKVAASSSEANAEFADVGDHWVAILCVVRGADVSGDPITFVQSAERTSSATTGLPIPSFTTVGDDNLVLLAVSNTDDNAGFADSTNFCDSGTAAAVAGTTTANGNDGGITLNAGTIAVGGTTISSATYSLSGSTGGAARNGDGIFVIGVKALGVSPIAATNSFSFSQTAAITGFAQAASNVSTVFAHGATLVGAGVLTASMAFAFGQTATMAGAAPLASVDNIAFTQTATLRGTVLAAATDSFTFGSNATGGTTEGTAGFANISFGQSGTLVGKGALASSTPFNFAQTAGVSGVGRMQAAMPFTFSQTATGRVDAFLTGSSAFVFDGWAIPQGVGALAASMPFSFAQSGAVVGRGALAGSSAMAFGHTANGVSGAFITGSTTLAFGGSGTLNGGTSSAGSTFLAVSQTATLRGSGRLIGSAPAAFNLIGTGLSRAYVAGSTTLAFAHTASLSSIVNPIYGDTWRNKWLAVYNTRQILLNKIADIVKGIADSKIKTYFTDTAPTVGLSLGDMWWNTVTKVLKRWNGAAWVDTADSTTAVIGTATVIRNPEFEQGLTDWADEAGGTIWSYEAGQGYLSGNAAKMQSGSYSGDRYLTGQTYVPARPGQRERITVMVKRAGSAVGVPRVFITWLDNSGFVGSTQSEAIAFNGSDYAMLTAEGVAPAGTTQYRVTLGVQGYTPSDAWYFDSVKRTMLDEYPALRQQKDNHIVNFDFEGGPYVNTDSGFTGLGYDPNVLPPRWINTWPGTVKPSWIRYDYDYEYEGTRSLLMAGPQNAMMTYADALPISPGEKITVAAALKGELANSATLSLYFYAADGSYTGNQSISNGATTGTWTVQAMVATAPANSASAVLHFIQGNATASWASLDRVRMWRALNLDREVEDGSDYVRYGIEDSYEYLGKRRIGMRIAGSGQRIGDQRNLPQSNTTAYGSIRNTTALTADSSGNVSVNAHTVRYGGVDVSYSAVTNAVTGLTVNNSYIIYCFDDNYAGGVRTWYAGTNPDAVMQLGDGVVVAGQITIPASGSSGGGGGGGGGDPADWCVDMATMLPDGRRLRDLVPMLDSALCYDMGEQMEDQWPLFDIGTGYADCYHVTTANGCEVIQSATTPMEMRDLTVCYTPDLFGKQVLTNVDGVLAWDTVIKLIYLGERRVLKPDFGNRMFFAGVTSNKTIATHNAIFKP